MALVHLGEKNWYGYIQYHQYNTNEPNLTHQWYLNYKWISHHFNSLIFVIPSKELSIEKSVEWLGPLSHLSPSSTRPATRSLPLTTCSKSEVSKKWPDPSAEAIRVGRRLHPIAHLVFH